MIMVIYLLTALFLGGFGNYLIPLMVGARDMVFPYVNMLSYWVYLLAVLVLVASFFTPGGPTGAGWTLYPPQAILSGTPGADWGIILMLVSLILFIIGFTMGGLNYVVTVLQARTRGMTLMRMPLTVWGILTATVLALLAFPALFVGCVMMLFDRILGTSFFMPAVVEMGEHLKYRGGSPLLFQHLFWFFGHPEVYIVALPAFGIVSDLISTHARRNIFGYRMMVWAIVVIGALSFVVWAHHMYVSGMNPYFGFFFATTTLIIAIPTAIKVYNWVLTLWRGDIHLTVPMLFALAFIVTFVNGGLTGLFLGNASRGCSAVRHHVRRRPLPHGDGRGAHPRDFRRDLPLVPEGHRANAERDAGQVPLLGHLPRGLRDLLPHALSGPAGRAAPLLRDGRYRPSFRTRPHTLNAFITVAALIVGFAQMVFLFNLIWSLFKGKPAGGNPWRATTLEWQTPETPPGHGNWGKELPVVYRWAYDYSVPGAERGFRAAEPAGGRARRLGRRAVSITILFVLASDRRHRRMVAIAAKADGQALAGSRRDRRLPGHGRIVPARREDRTWVCFSRSSARCLRSSSAPISCACRWRTGAHARAGAAVVQHGRADLEQCRAAIGTGRGTQETDGRRRIRPDCRRPLRLDFPGRAALCVAAAERRRLLLGGQPGQRLLLSVHRRARTALVGRPGGLGPDGRQGVARL